MCRSRSSHCHAPNFRPMIPTESSGFFIPLNLFYPMNLDFKFNADGLIPAIVQERPEDAPAGAGRVLMMAWMNRLSLEKTLETGLMHYWSRSRKKLWMKGETSGHTQKVAAWFVDCDRDTLLFEVEQHGAACHTGYRSCFFQELDRDGASLGVAEEKAFDPEAVYNR
jgi:phosphoribosyl-AMP cyclohydrolase